MTAHPWAERGAAVDWLPSNRQPRKRDDVNDNPIRPSSRALTLAGWTLGVAATAAAGFLVDLTLVGNMPLWLFCGICVLLGGASYLMTLKALRAVQGDPRGASQRQGSGIGSLVQSPERIRNEIALAVVRGSRDFVPLSERYRITDEVMAIIRFDGTTCEERTTDSE